LDAEMEAKIGYSKNERSTLIAEKNGQKWLINGIYAYLNLKLCMKAEYKIKPKNNRLKKDFS
jgi:hypothetical protein